MTPSPYSGQDIVFLLDVDNTLLDNDRVEADLRAYLERDFGAESQRYWAIFEELRGELGYADYLGTLQRYRLEHNADPHLLEVSTFLVDYPFAERLYPGALEVIAYLGRLGRVGILSDGDAVFQPRKIQRSGLLAAVENHVLIYIHKEAELEDVALRRPARHYVLVDDKVRILAAVKAVWGSRVTTVFPRQGHYALDEKLRAAYPTPDVTVEHIADLLELDEAALTVGRNTD